MQYCELKLGDAFVWKDEPDSPMWIKLANGSALMVPTGIVLTSNVLRESNQFSRTVYKRGRMAVVDEETKQTEICEMPMLI